MAVVVGRREVADDEVGALCRRHVASRCRRDEFLAVDRDRAVLDRHVLVAVRIELLDIGIAAVAVRRMVGEELLHGVFLSLGLVHDALPDRGTSAGVVIGMRDVLKRQRIRLALHRLRDVAVVDDPRHDCTEVRARRCAENRHIEAAPRPLGRMVLLPMTHFVTEHNGNLIVIRQDAEEARVDAHIVADCAEGVKALVLIDEVVVGLVVDRRVDRTNRRRQVRHDGVDFPVVVDVVVDAVLFLHLIEELLTAFF